MRFLFVDAAQRAGDTVALESEQTHYLYRVLRHEKGDSVDLVPRGHLERWSVVLDEPRKGRASASVTGVTPVPPAAGPPVRLYLAALKSDKLEWALQKTAELGVDSFLVLSARHSVKLAREVPGRFLAIAEAACQQSGRVAPPEIASVDLSEAIARIELDAGTALVLHPDESAERLSAVSLTAGGPVSYFIGPEGGFAAEELDRLAAAGATRARLTGHILRAETAAIAVGALLLARLGRL